MKKILWRFIALLSVLPIIAITLPWWVITGHLIPEKALEYFEKKLSK